MYWGNSGTTDALARCPTIDRGHRSPYLISFELNTKPVAQTYGPLPESYLENLISLSRNSLALDRPKASSGRIASWSRKRPFRIPSRRNGYQRCTLAGSRFGETLGPRRRGPDRLKAVRSSR